MCPIPARRALAISAWLLRAEALVVAPLAYLAVSAPLSRVLGRDTPAGQLALVSHDAVGSVLLVALPIFVLIHLVGRSSLHSRILRAGLSRVERIGLVAIVLFVALRSCQLSPVLGAGVLLVALGIFEWTVGDRRRVTRLIDLSVTVLYIGLLTTFSEPGRVRLSIIAALLLVQCEMIGFAWQIIRRDNEAVSLWGALSIAFTCAMLPFSLIQHLDPTAGAYCAPFNAYRTLHVVTATGFIVALAIHMRSVRKKMTTLPAPSKLFSLPSFVTGLVAITAWQLGSSAALLRHYAPPARIDAASVKAEPVSPYTRVEGYGQTQWDARLLQPAQSCGGCHNEVIQQHERSAHGRAFTNDAFQFQLMQFIRERGRPAADYCLACHAPLGVIAHPGGGPVATPLDPTSSEPAFTAGVTCIVCHRATPEKDRHRMGNASLAIRPLRVGNDRYLGEGNPDGDELHRQLIKLTPELHRRTFHIDRQDADAICAACHVVVLPANLSVDHTDHVVAEHYLSFADSPYVRAGLTCASCHQPRFISYEDQYEMVDHHYLGSGSSLPYRGAADDEHFRAVSMNFLRGLGDISLAPDTPAALPACVGTLAAAQASSSRLRERAPKNRFGSPDRGPRHRDLLQVTIDSVETGGDAPKVRISTTNECIGHNFPSGGGIKAYLEVQAFDAGGQIAGHYGGLGPDGEPVETATRLGVQAVDSEGKPIRKRRFWAAARVVYRKQIRPGDTLRDEISLPITPGRHAARIEATWYYLRPERFRNHERGIERDIPPVAIGTAEWRAAPVR